jgi:hypothetical protein
MAIALKIIYPVPDRSDQTINHVKNEYGEIDVGWAEGLMSDGRPFRMEMWAQDGVSMLTFFFSASGLEDLDDEKMATLVLAEGFVTFRDGAKQFIEKMLRDDPAGNATWSASIVVGDEDETFISGSLPVFAYSSSSEPRSVFNPWYLVTQQR